MREGTNARMREGTKNSRDGARAVSTMVVVATATFLMECEICVASVFLPTLN